MVIDISNLDKAEVLSALYNAAKTQGLGIFQYNPTPMSVDEARGELEKNTRFDYHKGRVMKVDLSGDTLNAFLYDRDNGEGAAMAALVNAGVL